MIKKDAPPLSTIYLYFSSACNLACRHCWIDPEFSGSQDIFGIDLPLDKIINSLEECIPLGLNSVKITGGEPFIRQDIFGLLDYLAARKINISVESNGTLIKEKEARAIKAAGVFHIAVSLDAPTEALHEELRQVKGSFKKTIEGIGHLKKAGINNIQIITCLWRRNAGTLKEMISFTKSLGVGSLKINPVSPTCRANSLKKDDMLLSVREVVDIYQKLRPDCNQNGLSVFFDLPPALLAFEDFKKGILGCCSIKNLLGIIADGTISICGIGKNVDKLVLGKSGKDRIKDIWENSPILKQIRQEIPWKLQGVCGRCIFRFYCLGKCRAEAFYETGDLLEPFYICQEAYREDFFPKSRMTP